MKGSPSKSMKTGAGKKRSCDEAAGSAQGSTPPTSPPRPNPNKEWKISKAKTEDLLVLVNSGFLREKEMDMGRAAAGDPYPMEKSPDEIPMFAWFIERGLALPASDFFKGLLKYYGIEYLNLNPNEIFHVSVFVHFCEAFVGIKPYWVLFRKFFRVKPQPSANDPQSSWRSRHPDARRRRRAVPLVQAHRLKPGLEVEMVLHHQPPPGTVEAEREAAKTPALVEHGANNPGGYPATRAAAEDQGFERSRAEGRTCGLPLYEEEGTTADGA
jgi:hypothetical protein